MPVYRNHTDEQLFRLLQGGEEAVFTEIFERYNKLLYSHVYNKLRDEEAARDVVQEVFIKLWEKRNETNSGNLAGYLFTLARNKVLNIVSHEKVAKDYAAYVKLFNPSGTAATDHLVRSNELAAIIAREIAALPPRMQEIFRLSREEWLTNKEIAAQLNLSEHTVADQIKKSLFRLRTRIGLLLVLYYLLGK